MSSQADTAVQPGARTPWLAILALGLVALACLFAAQPSQAAEVAGAPVSLPAVSLPESRDESFEETEEDEGCEEVEEESAEEEVEFEEECEEFEDDGEGSGVPPSECRLRTASARVFTHASNDQVSLVIGYTSFSPANATIGYRLKGSKGSLNLGQTRHHFSRQGVFRINGKLNEAQMAKVKAAKDFEVRIKIAATPGYCRSYYTRHLEAKRKVHGQVVWFQAK
jgi:hypothetical protein